MHSRPTRSACRPRSCARRPWTSRPTATPPPPAPPWTARSPGLRVGRPPSRRQSISASSGPDTLRRGARGLRACDRRCAGARPPAERAVRGPPRRAGRAARRPHGGRPHRPRAGRCRATSRARTGHLLARVHRGALGRARHGRGPAGAGPRRGIRLPGALPQCARGAQLRRAARLSTVPSVAAPQGMRPRVGRLAIVVLALSLATHPLSAQGITSAALQGRVVQVDGTPIDGAIVTATLAASGARWQVATDPAGRYFVENVRVGGPYVIEARAVGFKAATQSGVLLALGQRHRADFLLERMAAELPTVTISPTPVQPLT